MKYKYLLPLIIFLFYYGCAVKHPGPECIKNSKQYGLIEGSFRSRWWNFYERGLSYMEGECYKEAILDIREAILQREKDERMARTYGIHFVDYFPHRELGIIHFLNGKYSEALKELKLSVSQESSSKANYYIDEVRKNIIKQQSESINKPLINIARNEIWTNKDSVIIKGTVIDNQYVSEISVNDSLFFMESAKQLVDFVKELKLETGQHRIPIVAKNLPGGFQKTFVLVNVDRDGPVLSISNISRTGNTEEYFIKGHINDESGSVTLRINGELVHLPQGKELSFQKKLSSQHRINFFVMDKVGNITRASIDLKSFENNIKKRFTRPNFRRYLFARADQYVLNYLSDGPDILIESTPDAQLPGIVLPKIVLPKIVLNDLTDQETVYLEKIYIDGYVFDKNNVEIIKINNNEILHKKGQFVFFNYPIKLKQGINKILIIAKNKSGHEKTKEILVTRKIPSNKRLDLRLSMAAFPLKLIKETSQNIRDNFQSQLINHLINQKRFQIFGRKNPLDNLLDVPVDNLVNIKSSDKNSEVHTSLLGYILETRLGIESFVRVIDNETSEILTAKDVFCAYKDSVSLNKTAKNLAIKIHKEFPLLDGKIMSVHSDKELFIDMGKEEIKSQRRLILYRPEEGEKINKFGSDVKIIGYGRINKINENFSKARIINAKFTIETHDRVITQ